jgi:hypothetical protein
VRLAVAILVAAELLTGAPVASAGPICEDRAGEAVRCEDPRAMPLGWALPLEERLKHPRPGPPDPTPVQLGGVFILIFLFFTLIALMPDFEGWAPGEDEGEVEGDHDQD